MKIRNPKFIKRTLVYTSTVLLLCSPSLHSQDDEEIFDLSPFQVSGTEDIGYIATSTLAGSRLNTRLEDVAASISVVTKEFLEDIGAKNAGDLLSYTAGTEVGGTRGNFTNASAAAGGQGTPTDIGNIRTGGQGTRVRGLAEADSTRNYFQTSIPWDSYNTDRIEISRGSNAVLFGLGSPAGIINNTTQNALFTNDGRVRLEVDSFGSVRGEFNVNREVIKNVLAVRVAGLKNQRKFEQKDAFQDHRRLYVATSFQKNFFGERNGVWGGTIINANYESGRIDSNNPRTTPPADFVTPWFEPYTHGPLGTVNFTPKPAWDAHLARLSGSGEVAFWNEGQVDPNNATLTNPALQIDQSSGWHRGVFLMYQDVDAENPQYTAGGNLVGSQGRLFQWPTGTFDTVSPTGSHTYPFNAEVASLMTALGNWRGTTDNPDTFDGGILWKNSAIMDRSLFDFRKNLLEGAHNKWEGRDFDVYNLSLQQLFFRNKAGIELSLSEEKSTNWWNSLIGNADKITIDINKVLFDGTENPNFGRPIVFSGFEEGFHNEHKRNSERITGFVDLDMRDRDGLTRWLGRHVITGMLSSYEENIYRVTYATAWSNALSDLHLGNAKNPVQPDQANVGGVHYLGGSIAHMDSPAGARIPNIQANQRASQSKLSSDSLIRVHRLSNTNQFGDPLPDGFFDVPAPGIETRPSEGFTSRNKFDAQAAVLQSYLLKDHLIGTFTWRKDKVDVRTLPSAPKTADDSRAIVDRSTFNVDTLSDDDALISAQETTTWGFVAKLPSFVYNWSDGLITGVHGFYNESENFQPSAQRYSALYEPVGPPTGETKDYGIRLLMFDDKLNIKVTRYETSQRNNSAPLGWIPGLASRQLRSIWFRAHNHIRNGITDPSRPGYTGVLGYVPGTFHIRYDTTGDGIENVIVSEPPAYFREWYSMEYSGPDGPQWTWSDPGTATFLQDVEAKGYEIEVTYNPIPNWRIAFNATRQEAVQTGAGVDWEEWVNETPFWDTNLDGTPDTSLRDGIMGIYRDVARDANTTLPFFFTNWIDGWISRATVNNGQPSPELAKWSFNLISNYRFIDGRLQGLGIGGSVRWREATAIGYGLRDDSPTELDFNKVIKGDDFLRFQVWTDYTFRNIRNTNMDLNVRLNIRNLLNNKDLIPIQANPDGTITGVRIGEPRTFELVTTLSF